MRERPIIFSAPMVRAILAGNKTQTRRAIAPGNIAIILSDGRTYRPSAELLAAALTDAADFRMLPNNRVEWTGKAFEYQGGDRTDWAAHPLYVPGSTLWVRETLKADGEFMVYAADNRRIDCGDLDWPACIEKRRTVSSIHLPRWASRIDLRITQVRVERLQDIDSSGATAEGITRDPDGHGWHTEDGRHYSDTPVGSFASLWESVNGEGSWDANPWVWVVEFERTKP